MANLTDISRVEDRDEVLRRHVVQPWTKDDGSPMSVAFSPTPKDERKLSTDRQRIEPKDSCAMYIEETGKTPAGTWGIGVAAILDAHLCLPADVQSTAALHVLNDGTIDGLHDGHASIVFAKSFGSDVSITKARKHDERLAKELRDDAIARGVLYQPREG